MQKRLSQSEANRIISRSVRQHETRQGQGAPVWRVRKQTYEPGDSALLTDARVRGLGLVIQGHVAVFPTPRAASPLVVLTPGMTFGQRETAFVPAQGTLKALTPSEIWFVEQLSEAGRSPAERLEAKAAAPIYRWCVVAIMVLVALAALLVTLPAAQAELSALPLGIGDWCHAQGHRWCAAQAWTLAGRMAPRDATADLALGALAMERGDLDSAQRSFERACDAEPTSPAAHNNLGVVLYRRGQAAEAVLAFRRALALDPGSAAALRNLADAFMSLEMYRDALDLYQHARALGVKDPDILANMGVAHYQLGEPGLAAELMHWALALAVDEETRSNIDRSLAAVEAAAAGLHAP